MNRKNIKLIVDTLDDILEKLLSLPDDMLLQIDPRDNESLRIGYEFISGYNNELNEFSQITAKIKDRLETHFDFRSETEEMESSALSISARDRIIAELDKSEPHTLDENFTYKRPFGFVMGDAAYKGIKTWKMLYLTVLNELAQKYPDKFRQLPSEETFISSRGNSAFDHDIDKLRLGEKLEGFDFYAEVNLSANSLRDNLKTVFEYMGVSNSDITIYLREDRDA